MMACSTKWPPKLENEEAYENWKKDIRIWCELTELSKNKQALAVHLSLSGRAREASSEIPAADLKKDDGVDVVLRKLDELFLADAGRRQFSAFYELYNLRRPCDMNTREFVSKFEHVYFKFTEQGMTLPGPVKAFMLLSSCDLNDNERQLAMSAVKDVNYENMKSALCRIFGGGIGGVNTTISTDLGAMKSEPVFLGQEEELDKEVMYTNSGVRGGGVSGGVRGRGRGRGRGEGGRFNSSARRQNPVGRDGRVSRCVICGSRFHWARECPDSYENKNTSDEKEDKEETVHLSLFMGYAGNADQRGKLQTLVEEAKGCAVLDSGCSTTVCGKEWLTDFVSGLSDYELNRIEEERSTSTFTFADNVTVPSTKRVVLPCSVGGMCGTIKTDVVECNIPLLMSKKSMKRAKMIMNFDTDQVKIHGVIIDLKTSSSGHYLLPISA